MGPLDHVLELCPRTAQWVAIGLHEVTWLSEREHAERLAQDLPGLPPALSPLAQPRFR